MKTKWKEVDDVPKEAKGISCMNCEKEHETKSYFWYVFGYKKDGIHHTYFTCDTCGQTYYKPMKIINVKPNDYLRKGE